MSTPRNSPCSGDPGTASRRSTGCHKPPRSLHPCEDELSSYLLPRQSSVGFRWHHQMSPALSFLAAPGTLASDMHTGTPLHAFCSPIKDTSSPHPPLPGQGLRPPIPLNLYNQYLLNGDCGRGLYEQRPIPTYLRSGELAPGSALRKASRERGAGTMERAHRTAKQGLAFHSRPMGGTEGCGHEKM